MQYHLKHGTRNEANHATTITATRDLNNRSGIILWKSGGSGFTYNAQRSGDEMLQVEPRNRRHQTRNDTVLVL